MRDRARNTWQQDLRSDMKTIVYTWMQLERLAQDRGGGETSLVASVCHQEEQWALRKNTSKGT